MLNLLICGSRTFIDFPKFSLAMDNWVVTNGLKELTIIHGGAKGVDSLAGLYARENKYKEISVPAQWELYGKSAGYRRNAEMVKMMPDFALAFWDGKSVGTGHMIQLLNDYGINVGLFDLKDFED